MKIERNLNAWKNIIVKVVTDEDIEDMAWAAVIEEHGDEYLVVNMKDGRVFKYGCFANLKDSDYVLKNLSKQPELFKPLFKPFDSNSNPAQEICGLIHRYVITKGHNGLLSCEKIAETPLAQHDFYCLIDELDEIFKTSDCQYFCDSYKHQVKLFLEVNGIATEKNLAKLESARWNSRIDGIDGYAGKKEIDPENGVDFDSLVDTYNVSKDELEIVKEDDPDEWGVSGYHLNLTPDPILNANKKLYAAIDDKFKNSYPDDDPDDFDDDSDDYCYTTKWQDWMDSDVVDLKNGYGIMFDHTTIHNDVAYYLIIRKSDPKPMALYATLEEATNVINN